MGDPSTYQTRNNRLMYYEMFDISDPQTPALLERVYYEYSEDVQAGRQGSPTTIVWETPQPSGPAAFRAIDLQYNNSGELWLAIRRHWSGDEGCEEVIDGITEFRGSGRARRLVRQRDPACPYLVAADTTRWTDYDGDEAYADYAMTLDPQTGVASPVQTAAYLPGVGQMDMQTGWVSYTHEDQIGSLRAVSGSVLAGTPPERVTRRLVYTAFGEKVYDEGSGGALPPEDTRYQYAGAWGYESDAAQGLPFLHVGYRYYDPSTGRFLQRDPIGIRGGLNAYVYVDSEPLGSIDPVGLDRWHVDTGFTGHHYVIVDTHNPCLPYPFFRIDFYGTEGTGVLFDKGQVQVAPWRFPPGYDPDYPNARVTRISSTIQQDQTLLDQARRDDQCPPGYNTLLYNCKDYARYIKGVGLPPPRRPPFYCFVAGTPVLTCAGTRPIQDLCVGDAVYTWDVAAQDVGQSQVDAVGVTGYAAELVDVYVEESCIRSTRHHPYMVYGQGWVHAEDLRRDDLLITFGGRWVAVYNVECIVLDQPVPVYDVTIRHSQCFFVGNSEVLVHNKPFP